MPKDETQPKPDSRRPKGIEICIGDIFIGHATHVTISEPAIDGKTMLPRLVSDDDGGLVPFDPNRN